MTAVLAPVRFEAPLVNPAPIGLFPVTNWVDEQGALRWLDAGVEVRVHNYGGEAASGVWGASWCASPDDLTEDDIKTGERPDFLDPFDPIVAWAYDECDLTDRSRQEVRERAAQNLRLMAPVDVEHAMVARLLDDASTPGTAADIVEAVGLLEGEIAHTGTVGFIHASPVLAAHAVSSMVAFRSGGKWITPLGNTWVFGGGYYGDPGLGGTLVATSLPFGWRGAAELRDTVETKHNTYLAVAEQAFVIGYEHAIGAVTIS